MLKALFSSNTRVKILKIFLLNSDEEFFIRELTRRLDEQINSVRRELDNLKKIGFLRARTKNRKKYYHVNLNFIIYHELKSIVTKAVSSESNITKAIEKLGDIDLLIFSGSFIENSESKVDILIIGDIDKISLETYLKDELKRPDIRYSIIKKEDFIYRLNLKDRFISDIINNHQNIIAINKLKKYL
jgi:predicted transcriptional regulator